MAFKLQTGKAVNALIATIKLNLGAVDKNVNDAAIQSVAHARPQGEGGHGDWTLIKNLMVVLKASGYRAQGVRVWIEAHSPLRFPADAKAEGGFTVKVLKEGDKDYTPFNIEGMIATSFLDYEPSAERTGQPVYAEDLAGSITRTKKRFLALIDNTNADGTAKDASKPYYRGDIGAMLRYIQAVEAINVPEDRAKIEDEKAAQRQQESLTVGALVGEIVPEPKAA